MFETNIHRNFIENGNWFYRFYRTWLANDTWKRNLVNLLGLIVGSALFAVLLLGMVALA